MSDYPIGYRKPPAVYRYKPGVSGNPKGRPQHEAQTLGEVINAVLGGPISFREWGRTKSVTRDELTVKTLIERAVGGDVSSAELVLKVHAHARRFGAAASTEQVEVYNWLPEEPGKGSVIET